MIPNINPRDLKRMLKRMGIDVEEIENVVEVNILLSDRKITIKEPQVIIMKTPGQQIFQIIGTPIEEKISKEIEVSEEDIDFIVSQTGVSREEAREAIIKANGDLAEAIMLINENKV